MVAYLKTSLSLGLLGSFSLGTGFVGPEKVVMLLCFVAGAVGP